MTQAISVTSTWIYRTKWYTMQGNSHQNLLQPWKMTSLLIEREIQQTWIYIAQATWKINSWRPMICSISIFHNNRTPPKLHKWIKFPKSKIDNQTRWLSLRIISRYLLSESTSLTISTVSIPFHNPTSIRELMIAVHSQVACCTRDNKRSTWPQQDHSRRNLKMSSRIHMHTLTVKIKKFWISRSIFWANARWVKTLKGTSSLVNKVVMVPIQWVK